MKKVMEAIGGIYTLIVIAVMAWMFGFPKSYGRFVSRWQDKVDEGMLED